MEKVFTIHSNAEKIGGTCEDKFLQQTNQHAVCKHVETLEAAAVVQQIYNTSMQWILGLY